MTGTPGLICIAIPHRQAADPIRDRLARRWNVAIAIGLDQAQTALRRHKYRVGIIVVDDHRAVIGADVSALLQVQPAMQWIGVFPPGLSETPDWRELIVDSLVDFHTHPVDPERLAQAVGHTYGMARLLEQMMLAAPTGGSGDIVGESPAMVHLQRQIRKVARVDAPVLVSGESGTGKELAAQSVHRHSSRASGPFVPVNCGAIPATLIQSELFGYERGAFTGAAQARRGLFESAAGGTLFLDEIADLSLELQTNLLRFLQEKTINRVGSTQSVRIDVRIVAATHVNLENAVREGRFRQDLFYRLNVLTLTVPPLRERRQDIGLLAHHFFSQFGAEKNRRLLGFSTRALHAMEAHPWPGNVRELINCVRRAMVMAEGRLIKVADLGFASRSEIRVREELGEARVNAERDAIVSGLHRAHKNVSQAARDLGVSRMTLYRLMAKHDIRL